MCVIPGSLIGRALSRKGRGAGFEPRSWILLLQHGFLVSHASVTCLRVQQWVLGQEGPVHSLPRRQ